LPGSNYDGNVFVNCPFDSQYKPIFEAIVFAVHDCGCVARCALEVDDGSQVRIDKIFQLIDGCRLGIHDISRTAPDAGSGLPRFNMPLELGMFLGAKRYGSARNKRKLAIILDREPYRYQAFCSYIAGQDIRSHGNDPHEAIIVVRNWLRSARTNLQAVPSGGRMAERYHRFRADLPMMCEAQRLDPDSLIFLEFQHLVTGWLRENSW
jgi:hypothetical protein